MMEEDKYLKLENQLCFPLYAASRLMIRLYKTHLDKLGITYPQYLVMLVLWENDCLRVNEIGSKLYLNTNTLTPLLKRMQQLGLLDRHRCCDDERMVRVQLSDKGKDLKALASDIPLEMYKTVELNQGDAKQLKSSLEQIIKTLCGECCK